MSRMKILNAVEQEQFDSPPVFNSVQRKQYFDFSSELLTLAQDLQTPMEAWRQENGKKPLVKYLQEAFSTLETEI
jgi:hypothetical protein